MHPPQNDILREKLEVLNGDRPGAVRRSALRVEDLNGLLDISTKLQSGEAAGTAPTKEEFDALVADVDMLHRRLVAVMTALRERLR